MLAALAVLAFAGGVFTAYTLNRILENDPDIQAIREKERKLGDEIVYVAHGGKLRVHIYDPGSAEWFYEEEKSTETPEEVISDFDGYHFTIAAARDDGFGYAVVDKVQENESVPEYYAVFRVEIKDHIITDVTDAQMVEDLSEYSF